MGEERKTRKEGSCELCGKEWQPENFGSPRKCAFEGETFSGDNWNCGLVTVIRSEMGEGDGCHSLHFRDDEISTYGALVVAVPDPDPQDFCDYSLSGLLIGSWYKERGTCDDLKWGFRAHGDGSDDLTCDEAVLIAQWLKAREEAQYAREAAPAGFNFAQYLKR